MRATLIAGVVVSALFVPVAIAQEDEPQQPAPVVDTTTTTVRESPTTTSEFGTETEIVISLDNDGNIVPG